MLKNTALFVTKAFNAKNIRLFHKFFFYKVVLSKFFLFRLILLRLKYEIACCQPYLVSLPSHLHKITVLRSPHVHKKSRDQFETRVHGMSLIFNDNLNMCYYFSQYSLFLLLNFLFNFRDVDLMLQAQNSYVITKRSLAK